MIVNNLGIKQIRAKLAEIIYFKADIRDLLDTIESLQQPRCPHCGLTFDAGPGGTQKEPELEGG